MLICTRRWRSCCLDMALMWAKNVTTIILSYVVSSLDVDSEKFRREKSLFVPTSFFACHVFLWISRYSFNLNFLLQPAMSHSQWRSSAWVCSCRTNPHRSTNSLLHFEQRNGCHRNVTRRECWQELFTFSPVCFRKCRVRLQRLGKLRLQPSYGQIYLSSSWVGMAIRYKYSNENIQREKFPANHLFLLC